MRTKGSAAELERKRRRAVSLLEQGEKPADVCRILGVSQSSLKMWRRCGPGTGARCLGREAQACAQAS